MRLQCFTDGDTRFYVSGHLGASVAARLHSGRNSTFSCLCCNATIDVAMQHKLCQGGSFPGPIPDGATIAPNEDGEVR